jgi:hypothetical protein
MSDEWYTWNKSDTDIDSEHDEYLHRHRMTSGIEIDPEVREECHGKSWYPDRQTLWSKYEETGSDEYCRSDKKPSIVIPWHASLELGSCCIEEVAIGEEMDDPSMEKLEEADLHDQRSIVSCHEVVRIHPIELDELWEDETDDRYDHADEDEEMREGAIGIKRKHIWVTFM